MLHNLSLIFHKCRARDEFVIICCLVGDIAYFRGHSWVSMNQSRVTRVWGNWKNSLENSSRTVLPLSHTVTQDWTCGCAERRESAMTCALAQSLLLYYSWKLLTLFFARQYTNMPKLHLLGLKSFQLQRVSPHFLNKNYMQFESLRLHLPNTSHENFAKK